MIVCKFGGTSTARKTSLKNIKEICESEEKRIILFSAIGKSNKNDKKITDLLIELTEEKNNQKLIINKIKYKFNKLLNKINLKIEINNKIDEIIKNYNQTKDSAYLISRGEYLTSFIMAKYLNALFVPAEEVVYFNKNQINYQKIKEKLNYFLKFNKKLVIPGFYGVDENDKIVLFSRGGSDVSGMVVAKSVEAGKYEIWTDECGIKEVNPIFCKSKTIKQMGQRQLLLMASCDAKIVHSDCAGLLLGENIVLEVGSVFDPHKSKTIVAKDDDMKEFVCYRNLETEVEVVSSRGRFICDKAELKDKIIEEYKKIKERK